MNIYNYFDMLGILVFAFLLTDAIIDRKNGVKGWRVNLRLLIGILGIIIDGGLLIFGP